MPLYGLKNKTQKNSGDRIFRKNFMKKWEVVELFNNPRWSLGGEYL